MVAVKDWPKTRGWGAKKLRKTQKGIDSLRVVCIMGDVQNNPPQNMTTVLDTYAKLDKTIRDCEHALLIAERLQARGRAVPASEVQDVREKMAKAIEEREWLDGALSRAKEILP